jgi:hypothetical protein
MLALCIIFLKMTSNAIIATLDKYEFHDMAIESFTFNVERGVKLIVIALPFDDETNNYRKIELTFSNVIELKMDEIILEKDSEFELNTFHYEYNECFHCKLIFLLGPGKPSFTVELKCKNIELLDI